MITEEKLLHHISHLEQKHKELDNRLSRATEDYIIRVIKKEKLEIKDSIERCKQDIEKLKCRSL